MDTIRIDDAKWLEDLADKIWENMQSRKQYLRLTRSQKIQRTPSRTRTDGFSVDIAQANFHQKRVTLQLWFDKYFQGPDSIQRDLLLPSLCQSIGL